MSKLVRREFIGNRIVLLLLGISLVGIPLAILYIIDNTIEIHTEFEDPEAFLTKFKSKK